MQSSSSNHIRNSEHKVNNINYVLYARRSMEDDEHQQLSIPSQLEEVKKYAKANGFNIVEVLLESKTAKKPGRKVFSNLLERISLGELNGIISWHPDRLARNAVDAGSLIHLLDTGKLLDLKFPCFWFENTSQGKFMLNLAFGQSKYYVDSLAENTRRGLRAKAKQGDFPSLAPYGYTNNRLTKKIKVDPKVAPHIISLFERYATGKLTFEKGSLFLKSRGVVSMNKSLIKKDRIKYILNNPFYYGHFRYGGELYCGNHKPLVTKKLWDQVQRIVEGRSFKKPKEGLKLPFTGLMRCGECGMMITGEKQVKYYKRTNRTVEYVYYKCTKKHKTKLCFNPPISQVKLLPQINKVIQAHALPKLYKDKFLELLEKDEQQANLNTNKLTQPPKDELSSISQKQDRLLNLFLDESLTQEIYLQKKNELTSLKRSTDEKLTNLLVNPNAWIEPFRNWILFHHTANKISKPNTPYSKKQSFLLKTGSNLFLKQRILRYKKKTPLPRRLTPPLNRNAVPGKGLEPLRDYSQQILSLPRIPIPPPRR